VLPGPGPRSRHDCNGSCGTVMRNTAMSELLWEKLIVDGTRFAALDYVERLTALIYLYMGGANWGRR
jgi:hypothetical protein